MRTGIGTTKNFNKKAIHVFELQSHQFAIPECHILHGRSGQGAVTEIRIDEFHILKAQSVQVEPIEIALFERTTIIIARFKSIGG